MPEAKNVRCAAGRCGSGSSETVVHIPGNPSATTRTTSEWVCPDCDYFEEAEEEEQVKNGAPRLARADGQQNFFAERILELFEVQRGLALVAQHFEHRRTALFGHFHAAAFDIHDVHLQRFDQKVPVVAAIRTGQRHL